MESLLFLVSSTFHRRRGDCHAQGGLLFFFVFFPLEKARMISILEGPSVKSMPFYTPRLPNSLKD